MLLVQNLLAVNDVDALLNVLQTLAPNVVNATEGGLLGFRLRGQYDAGGLDRREGLMAYALQLEGVDAEAGLAGEIDDDTQRYGGLFGKEEVETSIHKLAPGKCQFFTFLVAYHASAFVYHKSAVLGFIAVAERYAETVFAGRKCNGLPQAVVEKRSGKTAPLCFEGDVTLVLGVYVCTGCDVS